MHPLIAQVFHVNERQENSFEFGVAQHGSVGSAL